jgi:pyruvate,water dikinase
MLMTEGSRCEIGSKAFDLYRCSLLGVNVPGFVVVPTDRFKMGKIGKALKEELRQALDSLGGSVAVRSSSVAEDLAIGSNAGQYRTVLNVGCLQELLKAVRVVWDSANGNDMAVIVQKQVVPDIAGVLFTRDPSSGGNETVIEYVPGLGESLVSGRRDPKRFVFHNRKRPKGKFKQLLLISRKLERKFGYPLDIEWAKDGGGFYILQARPIVGLPVPPLDAGKSYSRVQAEQFNSGPVSPLFFSLFKKLHSKYYLKDTLESVGVGIFDKHSILKHKNYLYFDTRYAEYAFNHLPVRGSQKHLMKVLPQDIRDEISKRKVRTDPRLMLGILRFMAFNPRFWICNLDRHFQMGIIPKLLVELETIGDLKEMSDYKLLSTYERIERVAALHIGFSKWGLGLYSIPLVGVMQGFLKRNGIDEDLIANLISGLELNKTLDASLSLNELARTVRESPELVGIFKKEHSGYNGLREELEKTSHGQKILDSFEFILRRFGHRRLARDILKPSWKDEPEIPLAILKELVLQDEPPLRGPGKKARLRRLRTARRIEKGLPRGKRIVFRLLCRYLVRYTAFRELQRFYLDMILSRTRELFLEIEKRMVEDGAIDRRDDVFFLDLGEILGFLKKTNKKDLRWIAEFNRLSFYSNLEAPGMYMRLGVDFDTIGPVDKVVKKGNKIKGQAISPGQSTGRMRIVDNIDHHTVISKGDIIVTRCIDPGQTHILLLAGGLVLEVGGMLSHGAILAREFNVPTVGQVKNATRLLKDGKKIFIDGSKGEIVDVKR